MKQRTTSTSTVNTVTMKRRPKQKDEVSIRFYYYAAEFDVSTVSKRFDTSYYAAEIGTGYYRRPTL
jgi:hypothetical protein